MKWPHKPGAFAYAAESGAVSMHPLMLSFTVYTWTLEALAIGSLVIYAITWMVQKRRAQG
jgi:hypothetical protein